MSKVDVLFMIDNSTSMGDKQTLLASAVPDMINRLVAPNCVSASGAVLGRSQNGLCTAGALEFAPVHDMHLGIVTSSLGGRGSVSCDATLPNSANPALPSHNDDRGELVNRGGANEVPITNAGSPLNFLAWYPPVGQNTQPGAAPPPVPPETVAGDPNTPGTLIGDFTQMIAGVHEHGCGFEAQNEAWYRFLVQPDPYSAIQINTGNYLASFNGVDATLLMQRKAFLRDDSLLLVVVVSDESQEVANPLSIGRLGWLFEQAPWPNSTTGGAPQGSIECENNPLDPMCVSCTIVPSSQFATRCPPIDNGSMGYLPAADDPINLRFYHQKQRFGVFAGYPSSRYVVGLTSPTVPDSAHEVDANGNYVGDQAPMQNCVNPIFATNLPADPTQELCHLEPGPRTPDLVYYAFIGGVPHQLLQASPGDPECPAGTAAADCPQKHTLAELDWLKITGRDPENYDFSGADFHMLESPAPRPASSCPPGASDDCDPINGREWNSQNADLQFACTFDLAAPKDCTQQQFSGACDCVTGSASNNSPLCQKDNNGNYTTTQIKGKAYPGILELAVAHAMASQPFGVQGIVSSMCPIHTTASSLSDPVYGYRPAMGAIVDRIGHGLAPRCLGVELPQVSSGAAACNMLVTLAQEGDETMCTSMGPGLVLPDVAVLGQFQASRHAAWLAAGGTASGQPDPSLFPTCQMPQLVLQNSPMDFAGGTCAASPNPGWCYVTGAPAMGCSQQIVLTAGEPPLGAALTLQCTP